jgi:hypothetical protein
MIEITDFHVSRPLQDLLIVPKDWDPVESALREAKSQVEKMWGAGRPTLVVPPREKYPGYVMHAWLRGPEKDPDMHGSHLIVTWFAERIPEDPLKSALARVEQAGGWDALAKDFEY